MGSVSLNVSPVKNEDLPVLNKAYRDHIDDQMLDRALGDKEKDLFFRSVFQRMDRNKNGIYDPDERQHIIGFLKRNGMWPEVPGFNPKTPEPQ